MMEKEEIWKDVPGYHGLYQASTLGRIKSFVRRTEGKILKPHSNGKYLCCELFSQPMRIHRLVAITFLDNPLNLPEVNHKNAVREDNSLENLEWVTHKQNQEHAVKLGRYNNRSRGEKNNKAKLTNAQVLEIRNLKGKLGGVLAGRQYNISKANVYSIWKNKTWKHIA